jgi:putative transposase
MRTYLRHRKPGGLYFFTVNLAVRQGNTLLVDQIEALRSAFFHTLRDFPATLDAIAVLPDHLHCLWQMPEGDDNFETRWRLIKSRFSRAIDKGERRSESRLKKGERGIWQRRYWEHIIRDEEDYARHVDYIHYNPVKHGYVQQAKDWPYSSFSRWVAQGIYTENWGAGNAVQRMEQG